MFFVFFMWFAKFQILIGAFDASFLYWVDFNKLVSEEQNRISNSKKANSLENIDQDAVWMFYVNKKQTSKIWM